MPCFSRRMLAGSTLFLLTATVALSCTIPAWAQTTSGTAGGMGTGGGFGASSLGGGLGGTGFGGGTTLGGGTGLGGTSFGGGTALGGGTTFGGGTAFSGGAGLTGGTTVLGSSGAARTGAGFGGAAGGTANYTSPGIAETNPFASHYANPMTAGMPGGSRASFGTPLYGTITAVTTPTSGGLAGGRSGTGGIGGTGLTSSGAVGVRAPAYSAALGFPYRPAAPSRLQTDLKAMLGRSSSLPASRDIQVVVLVDSTVVLRGKVADEHDRRLAEGLVRLSPGVHAVRNELQVPGLVTRQDAVMSRE